MATVYLARDPKHDRQVAIKVLKPGLASVVGVERFLNKIRVTAGCNDILALDDDSGFVTS